MPELDKQRDLRRDASSWLTKKINTGGFGANLGAAIRGEVIETLSRLYNRFTLIDLHLRESCKVRTDRSLIRFYMKGGNAFECIRDPKADTTLKQGGGDSDWDTQVVIDPWAPPPLQDLIYGLVEDIVLDEFRQAGQRIAEKECAYITRDPGDWVTTVGALWTVERGPNYLLSYDSPQAIRRVYDRDRLGLWTDTRRQLGDRNLLHPEWMPGVVLNNAIKAFDLYRLGYTWHMTATQPVQPDTLIIEKPLLMELIDVTIPRRDTIEAVAVWKELEEQHITLKDYDVGVEVHDMTGTLTGTITRDLALPDLSYHLREQLTMICEVADNSSHHASKIIKRFQRLNVIWEQAQDKSTVLGVMNDFAGVDDITACDLPAETSHSYIVVNDSATNAERNYFGFNATDPDQRRASYLAAWRMMYWIERRAAASAAAFSTAGIPKEQTAALFKNARAALPETPYINYLAQCFAFAGQSGPLELAYSDDLVLGTWLGENGYLDVAQMPLSGFPQAAVIRISSLAALNAVMDRYANSFATQCQFTIPPPNSTPLAIKGEKMILQPRVTKSTRAMALASSQPKKEPYTLRYKMHQTPRGNGFTHECLLVILKGKRAIAVLTLTTATASELPFLRRQQADGTTLRVSPPSEIARQRKVAAALVDDYLIKTAIARQYDMLKEILIP